MVAPEVVLADGDEASGLATMLADVLRDNVRDYQGRARVASLARGEVVLRASDRDVSVTLSFCGRQVVVTDGVAAGAPVVAGPWLEMAKLCSGQLSPVKAVRTGDLRVTPGRHVTALAGAGYALSVPPSFYGDDEAVARRRRQVTVSVVVVVAVVAVAVVARSRARRG